VSEIPDLETLDAFAELARQISVLKCWLCSTPIGEKYDDDYESEYGVFLICKECDGKELFPRSQVWRLMQGLQSTQNHTGRERAKLNATISALWEELARWKEAHAAWGVVVEWISEQHAGRYAGMFAGKAIIDLAESQQEQIAARDSTISALRASLREARAAFKDAEWTRPASGGPYFCPACRHFIGRGHRDDCYIKANIVAVDALLAEQEPPE
jgi:hypothetical protein